MRGEWSSGAIHLAGNLSRLSAVSNAYLHCFFIVCNSVIDTVSSSSTTLGPSIGT